MISGEGVSANTKCEVRSSKEECDGITISAPLLLLTKDELAAALRVSLRTVQEMVSGQEIPVVRIRGAVRFYLPGVVRSLTANAVTSKRGCAHRLAGESDTEVGAVNNFLPQKLQPRSQMQRVARHPGGNQR